MKETCVCDDIITLEIPENNLPDETAPQFVIPISEVSGHDNQQQHDDKFSHSQSLSTVGFEKHGDFIPQEG